MPSIKLTSPMKMKTSFRITVMASIGWLQGFDSFPGLKGGLGLGGLCGSSLPLSGTCSTSSSGTSKNGYRGSPTFDPK